MIEVNVTQGSPEWIAARIGLPTASQFHRIITPKTMKPSAGQTDYLHELLAEWMLGASLDTYQSDMMLRGRDEEESAFNYYELQKDVAVRRVGLCMTDDGMAGASPDGLVDPDGGLELKCPGPKVHVSYLMGDMKEAYKTQIQGGLWVTGRQWWDFMSYHPEMPPALVRVERDENFISLLAEQVVSFAEKLKAAKDEMLARGYKKE